MAKPLSFTGGAGIAAQGAYDLANNAYWRGQTEQYRSALNATMLNSLYDNAMQRLAVERGYLTNTLINRPHTTPATVEETIQAPIPNVPVARPPASAVPPAPPRTPKPSMDFPGAFAKPAVPNEPVIPSRAFQTQATPLPPRGGSAPSNAYPPPVHSPKPASPASRQQQSTTAKPGAKPIAPNNPYPPPAYSPKPGAPVGPTLTPQGRQELDPETVVGKPPKLGADATKPFPYAQKYQQVSTQYKPLIDSAAAEFGIPPQFLYAVILAESGGNAQAANTNRNTSRDIGLMQLNDVQVGSNPYLRVPEDRLDPRQNIYGGAWYLSQMLQKAMARNKNTSGQPTEADMELAYRMYNGGPSGRNNRRSVANARKVLDIFQQVLGIESAVAGEQKYADGGLVQPPSTFFQDGYVTGIPPTEQNPGAITLSGPANVQVHAPQIWEPWARPGAAGVPPTPYPPMEPYADELLATDMQTPYSAPAATRAGSGVRGGNAPQGAGRPALGAARPPVPELDTEVVVGRPETAAPMSYGRPDITTRLVGGQGYSDVDALNDLAVKTHERARLLGLMGRTQEATQLRGQATQYQLQERQAYASAVITDAAARGDYGNLLGLMNNLDPASQYASMTMPDGRIQLYSGNRPIGVFTREQFLDASRRMVDTAYQQMQAQLARDMYLEQQKEALRAQTEFGKQYITNQGNYNVELLKSQNKPVTLHTDQMLGGAYAVQGNQVSYVNPRKVAIDGPNGKQEELQLDVSKPVSTGLGLRMPQAIGAFDTTTSRPAQPQ